MPTLGHAAEGESHNPRDGTDAAIAADVQERVSPRDDQGLGKVVFHEVSSSLTGLAASLT